MAIDRADGNGVHSTGMTRRQLLRRFGILGGSSLVLGAMDALELGASPSSSKPALRGTQDGHRVLVLGAGISGMVTAYELGKLGYDCQILEARDRVGGLNWTVSRGSSHTELGTGERQVCRFDDGQYFNAGPWRIPHHHTSVIDYCRELNVRLEPFNDLDMVMYSEDPSLGSLAQRKVLLRNLESDLWGQTSELLAKATNQGALDQYLSTEDKERLIEFLDRAGYLDGPDHVYKPDPEVRGSDEKYDLSVLLQTPFAERIRSVYAGTGGPYPVLQPTGGMMQFAIGFERVLRDRITFGAEVVSIRQSDDDVRVVYEDTASGDRRELVADHAVICLPMSILQKLDVNFSAEMQQAVDSCRHSGSSKLGLQMGRRFWERDDEIYGGHLRYEGYSEDGPTRSPLPQFSYPSNDFGAQKGVLLGYYGNGAAPGLDGTTPLSEVAPRERVEYVLTHASKVHPQIREEYEAAYSVWWPQVPYSEGAWARTPSHRLEQLRTPDDRLFIGAAAASDHPAWFDGAIGAAWNAVENLHEGVMRD